MAPKMLQLISTITDSTSRACCQPNVLISMSVTGAKMNVPSPEPQTAIPVASDRNLSKYIVTLTMAGR